MISIAITDPLMLVAFWLSFARWTAIMINMPIFDNSVIPGIVKVLSAFVISYAFFPVAKPGIIAEINHVGLDMFWMLTISHVLIGLIIGYLVKSIMGIFQASGSVMTQQIGFASLTYFDPSVKQQVGPFERMIQWTLVIMIISSGALMPIFKGVISSFFTINAISWGKLTAAPEYFIEFFKYLFTTAVVLATPLLMMNLLLNMVMGIVARTIPQMNILMVSFAVNIGLGLLVFFAISEEYFQLAFKIYVDQLTIWFNLVV
jgi:flagellar biosynthetic protein FliR